MIAITTRPPFTVSISSSRNSRSSSLVLLMTLSIDLSRLDNDGGVVSSGTASFRKVAVAHSVQLAVRERALVFERGDLRSVVIGIAHDRSPSEGCAITRMAAPMR